MTTTILVTGSTDGIGRGVAERLSAEGHRLLLHGRDESRLASVAEQVEAAQPGSVAATLLADLSQLSAVEQLAAQVADSDQQIDVLVNNAGVYQSSSPVTSDGLDARFAVNTIAPYVLTQRLQASMPQDGRVVNLSSAAQSPVDVEALTGRTTAADDMAAYSQSKLAMNMWSRQLGLASADSGPMIVAVNPGSLLGTKMVREGFGIDGKDVAIGVDIVVRAALSNEFADASGAYYDNDAQRFSDPHPDALDPTRTAEVVTAIDEVVASASGR